MPLLMAFVLYFYVYSFFFLIPSWMHAADFVNPLVLSALVDVPQHKSSVIPCALRQLHKLCEWMVNFSHHFQRDYFIRVC